MRKWAKKWPSFIALCFLRKMQQPAPPATLPRLLPWTLNPQTASQNKPVLLQVAYCQVADHNKKINVSLVPKDSPVWHSGVPEAPHSQAGFLSQSPPNFSLRRAWDLPIVRGGLGSGGVLAAGAGGTRY